MRLKVVFGFVLFAALFALAQEASQELLKLNQQYNVQYKAAQFSDALATIDKMLALSETAVLPGVRPSLLFNKACALALLGRHEPAIRAARASMDAGYTDWHSFSKDSDLNSLRGDSDFKALLAEIRQKYGPKPLVWDTSQPAPVFPLRFDDLQAPEIAQLRSEFHIDEVVSGGGDDYDRLIRLTQWTSGQWKHDSTHSASKLDPITILREAKAGGRFICQNYAIVLAGATRSCGLYARLLAILPADVETRSESHSVVEVWLPAFRKWALADAQFGIVPELKGAPMDALELRQAIAEDAPIRCKGNDSQCAQWQSFIINNLYYFKIGDDQRRFGGHITKQLVLVPKGAKEPHLFAGGNQEVFAGAIYTGNPAGFRASPDFNRPAKDPEAYQGQRYRSPSQERRGPQGRDWGFSGSAK